MCCCGFCAFSQLLFQRKIKTKIKIKNKKIRIEINGSGISITQIDNNALKALIYDALINAGAFATQNDVSGVLLVF